MKRLFDFGASSVLLLLSSPFLLMVAIAVRLDSRGPVFHRGERVGLNGVGFRILKFRTMVQGAELAGTTTGALDHRVTRSGRFLRRYKFDELPQLINVWRGEMSLVGPRPEVDEHTSEYTQEEREILTVRPGITDLSSIHFFRLTELLGSTDPHRVFLEEYRSKKNALRLEYVRTQSAWLDCCILIASVTTLFSGGRWVLRLSPQIRPVARRS